METVTGCGQKPEDAAQLQRDCDGDAPRTRQGKVRLRSLDDLDNRTAAARRARDLVADLESDLGGGDRLPVGLRELVKRAAMLGAIVEDCEVRWLERKPVDLAAYLSAVNAQRRVLATIGLDRRPRDITPDPLAYARQRAETGP
jgi:hypothetical protein